MKKYMKSRGLGFSQVVSTFWIFYFFYLKKVIKVQKSTKSKLGVFLMLRSKDREEAGNYLHTGFQA